MKRRRQNQNTITQGELDEFLSAITSHDFANTSRILKAYPFLVRYKDERGATPLHMAATVLDEKIIKLLLDNGADVNSVDNQGLTPLHNASLCNAVGREDGRPFIEYAEESFKTLLDGGANPNARTTDSLTPLHVLVSSGTVVPDEVLSSLASVLIDNGADPTLENDAKQTALDSIIAAKEADIKYSIRTINQDRNNQEPSQPPMTQEAEGVFREQKKSKMLESPLIKSLEVFKPAGDLIRAIKTNDHDEISRIITDHPEALKFQGENGNTPLHIALAEKGCSVETVDLVYKTMDENDRRNIRNKQGVSAQDMVDVIGYIAEKPTPQKKMDILNNDPQLVFVKKRDGKTLIDEELKLNKGLKAEDIAQGYFLMRLIDNNEQEAAVSLIKTNPQLVNFRDSNGDSLFHHALHSSGGKFSSVTTALTEAGANQDIPNKAGLSARDIQEGYHLIGLFAKMTQQTEKEFSNEIVDILRKNPKLKDFRDLDGSTPLHSAVLLLKSNFVDLFLDKGANIEARDSFGNSPLHNAALASSEQYLSMQEQGLALIKSLIEKGADAKAQNDKGDTFLHIIAKSGEYDGIWEDIKKEFPSEILNIKNKEGRTCDEIIAENIKAKERELSRTASRAESSEPLVSSDRSKSDDTMLSSESRSSSEGGLSSGRSSSDDSIWSSIGRRLSSAKSYVMSFFRSSDDRLSSSSSDYQDAQSGGRSTAVSNRGESPVISAEFHSIDGGSALSNTSAEFRESSRISKVSEPRSPKSTAIDFEALDKEERAAVKAAGDAFDALYERGDRGLVHKSTKRTSSSYKPRGSFLEH